MVNQKRIRNYLQLNATKEMKMIYENSWIQMMHGILYFDYTANQSNIFKYLSLNHFRSNRKRYDSASEYVNY